MAKTERFLELREKANDLPLLPGVYIMKDKAGEVIYVGKAIKLKNRVSSYFHGEHNAKTEAMVAKIQDFDVIIANSEFEALVLENSLIKHHMPRYNILLKDDKGYPFIRCDMREEYPTFSIVSKPKDDGAKYYGPYGGRGITKNAIDAVLKALKMPTCGRKFPRDIGKERPCLNYHMKNCTGYCLKDASAGEYRKNIRTAVMIFEGKSDELVKALTDEMMDDAENLRFELAAEKRDRINAITALRTKQRVVAGSAADTDAVGLYLGQAKSCFVVLHYIGGTLLDKDYEIFETPIEDREEALSGILRQYYFRRGIAPNNILLPWEIPDMEEIQQSFEQYGKAKLLVPQRGDKVRLVESAMLNAKEETERATTKEEKTLKTLEWLKNALGLEKSPDRVEAFDISNTGSSDIVASMVVFHRGKSLKRDYRRFKIKTITEQDDFHSMEEVVTRRLQRYLDGDEKFAPLPDLMLIDGGEVHANIAKQAALRLGLDLPIFGMVKDDRHRTRALITPEGEEIGIVANPAVFAYIGTIQEETHRFAIEYHHSLHNKSAKRSVLDSIEGVGEKRRQKLIKHFGTIRAIKEASIAELAQVVPKNTAETIYYSFRGKNSDKVEEKTT
ncbi:MAG: excinuclease ABC subunit UvrC [Oscillospiraceae bacterium]|nr:excinuclease ABC subunit UvrC [Oscillospiraceae bacterium]